MNSFEIDHRKIGVNEPAVVVAEVGQAHDGSLGTAHAYIDASALSGADAVKFQTHIAHAESTPSEPWRVKFSSQDRSRFDYWKRMEFSKTQWAELHRHASEKGLIFLSSPFSIEAVELLSEIGIKAWKVASGEFTNRPLLQQMVKTKLPLLLSTGMSSWSEIDDTTSWLKQENTDFLLFQCTSHYPCPPEKVGLNLLSEYRTRVSCPVGLSDHSGTIYPSLAAAALGVEMIEVHVTLSRQAFGPDVSSSVTFDELKQLIVGVRWIECMRQSPINKDEMSGSLSSLRDLFTKSVVLKRNLPEGCELSMNDLTTKKPGTGIPANRLNEVIGKRLRRAVKADELFTSDDLEPVIQ